MNCSGEESNRNRSYEPKRWNRKNHNNAAAFSVVGEDALLRACETLCSPDASFSAVLVDDSARKLLERLGGEQVSYQAAWQWKIAL